MNIHVTGVAENLRDEAARVIREALGGHPLESSLHIHATRFGNGEWIVFITDLAEVEIVDGALADRLRKSLQGIVPRRR